MSEDIQFLFETANASKMNSFEYVNEQMNELIYLVSQEEFKFEFILHRWTVLILNIEVNLNYTDQNLWNFPFSYTCMYNNKSELSRNRTHTT